MSSYDGKTKKFGDYSKVSKQKTKNGKTLENTKCSTGIEADITLKGSGSGYHAKLVLVTSTSAVSYGTIHRLASSQTKILQILQCTQEWKRP